MTDESTNNERNCTDDDLETLKQDDLETLKRNLRRLTTLAVRLRRFSDAARVALQRYKDADESTAPDSYANHRWYEFVAAMWAAQARVLEAGRLGRETAELLERRRPQGRSDSWTQYPYRAELVERLARQGLDPDFVGSLAAVMPASLRDWPKRWGATTWTEVFEATQRRGVDLGAWIRGSVLVAAGIPERRRVLESLLPDGGELHPLGGEIPCAALPEPWSGVCTGIAITILVIGATAALIEYFDWSFDDDRAREFIGRRTCSELRALPDADLISLIRRLQDGLTLDDDERAILRILGCLPCERVRTVVSGVGSASLLFDLDGASGIA